MSMPLRVDGIVVSVNKGDLIIPVHNRTYFYHTGACRPLTSRFRGILAPRGHNADKIKLYMIRRKILY